MTPPELSPLLAAVRTNCQISDAQHARALALFLACDDLNEVSLTNALH